MTFSRFFYCCSSDDELESKESLTHDNSSVTRVPVNSSYGSNESGKKSFSSPVNGSDSGQSTPWSTPTRGTNYAGLGGTPSPVSTRGAGTNIQPIPFPGYGGK